MTRKTLMVFALAGLPSTLLAGSLFTDPSIALREPGSVPVSAGIDSVRQAPADEGTVLEPRRLPGKEGPEAVGQEAAPDRQVIRYRVPLEGEGEAKANR